MIYKYVEFVFARNFGKRKKAVLRVKVRENPALTKTRRVEKEETTEKILLPDLHNQVKKKYTLILSRQVLLAVLWTCALKAARPLIWRATRLAITWVAL